MYVENINGINNRESCDLYILYWSCSRTGYKPFSFQNTKNETVFSSVKLDRTFQPICKGSNDVTVSYLANIFQCQAFEFEDKWSNYQRRGIMVSVEDQNYHTMSLNLF